MSSARGDSAAVLLDLDAERSVLGSLIIDKDAIVKISDKLVADDFAAEQHRYIYEAVLSLYENRRSIDILTLTSQLKSSKRLEDAGGAAYLTELTNYVPTAAHVTSYAEFVVDKSIRRQILAVNKDLESLVLDATKTPKELLEIVQAELYRVGETHITQSVVSLEQILESSFERLDALHRDKKKLRGIPTGFKDLDGMIAGLQRSDLFILAARPAMGKTAFVLNLAHNIATRTKESVLMFSLEMSKDQLVDRLLSMESGVDAWALRTGDLTDSDFEKIGSAMGTLSEAPIFIDDTPAITIQDLRTKALREAHHKPIGVIIVDYLQLMSGGGRFGGDFNRVQEISEISRGLKVLARELNVPVIALSQLSRSVESRPDKIPQLSDLRESGSIEQDADIVAFIFREDYYNPETERKNITDILIKKHRNGPVGGIELYFDTTKQRFKSLDHKHAEKDPFSKTG
jgi:replicative DNA helicase